MSTIAKYMRIVARGTVTPMGRSKYHQKVHNVYQLQCSYYSSKGADAFKYKDFSQKMLTFEPSSNPQDHVQIPKEDLVFGQQFTPHMLMLQYESKKWSPPKIIPFQNISISPASSGLH
jgi:hypothetical protein